MGLNFSFWFLCVSPAVMQNCTVVMLNEVKHLHQRDPSLSLRMIRADRDDRTGIWNDNLNDICRL